MKKLKLLWRVFKTTDTDKILLGFAGFVLFAAFIFTLAEPEIKRYADGLWYAFAVFTTTGFGDIVATTLVGRAMTILLGLYGILIVALIPGVVVNYYSEISKIKANSSVEQFMEKLERLPELTKDELEAVAAAVRKRRYKL